MLLPDELDALIWYSTLDADTFVRRYSEQIDRLRGGSERRLSGQLEALAAVTRDDGAPYLTDDDVERMLAADTIQLTRDVLLGVFRLDAPNFTLPRFARRLRAYKTDRGL